MYTISSPDVARFDLQNARPFVEFWDKCYGVDDVKVLGSEERIDYFAELNIANDLTEENVRRLLRWKDPRHLTHLVLSGPNEGKSNQKVEKVLACLGLINQFRHDQAPESGMRPAADQAFESGIVWKAFLLHIAKPHTYPIADQNVFRAWSLHTGLKDEKTWDTYAAYCNYFAQIAEAMGIDRTMKLENIRELKRIDNALFVFGQLLGDYYEPATQARSSATTEAGPAR